MLIKYTGVIKYTVRKPILSVEICEIKYTVFVYIFLTKKIFQHFLHKTWMYKVLDYFFSLFLVYFKYLIDLKKKEKNIFFLLQFFLQVLSLFLYLITFFVASST